mmetsp:Transcript_13473/g.42432  ORF Transcript_13473/g.42432 Transcript_13473/m.42432 type:complete len:369 (-) Transcript_13473:225-1331(-)|eukprot:CAMPEP_0170738552 /NCGR_PEP_ID=MMETSP0437-20130122/4704_1 /TAXON_ID=0 /ORGANISM="Sexangularia sp." /LENGTH=368 /DNA_ID=CAMNT_0011076979 /DNA_START=120 /DNA_END=1226 /DNA_ORIENTATION=+
MTQGVFVGNLDRSVSSEQLEEFAAEFGPIESLILKKGYAFVFFGRVDDARAFISAKNGAILGKKSSGLRLELAKGDGKVKSREGERMKTARSTPSPVLFVANYSVGKTSQQDLATFFSKYGEVIRVEIVGTFSFVEFGQLDSAKAAFNDTVINGNNMLNECQLHIEYSVRRRNSTSSPGRPSTQSSGDADSQGTQQQHGAHGSDGHGAGLPGTSTSLWSSDPIMGPPAGAGAAAPLGPPTSDDPAAAPDSLLSNNRSSSDSYNPIHGLDISLPGLEPLLADPANGTGASATAAAFGSPDFAPFSVPADLTLEPTAPSYTTSWKRSSHSAAAESQFASPLQPPPGFDSFMDSYGGSGASLYSRPFDFDA